MREVLQRFWGRLDLTQEEAERARFSSRRYPPILTLLSAAPPRDGQKILDLGGGIGNLSVALHARFGGEYHIADFRVPSPSRQSVLRDFGVTQCFDVRLDQPDSLSALPLDYDWVVFAEVLEHLLTNPLRVFREIFNHLRPEGRLVLTTPNQARARNRVKLAMGRSIKEAGRFPPEGTLGYGHVMEYTVDELDELLTREGFRVERTTVIQNLPSIRTTPSQRALVRILNTSVAANLRLGDDILLVARKGVRAAP